METTTETKTIGDLSVTKTKVRPLWTRAKFVIPMVAMIIDAVALFCTVVIFAIVVEKMPEQVPNVIEFSKSFVGPAMLYIAGAGGVGGVGVAAHDSFRDRNMGNGSA